jgi:hypothetical protein
MQRHRLPLLFALAAGLAACGPSIGDGPEGAVDAGPAGADAAAQSDAGQVACMPADFFIVLDRTGSMAQRPDGTLPPNTAAGMDETKWHTAVDAIESVTAALDGTVRFGLGLFPRDQDGADGTDCSNLGTWLTQYLPPETNDASCQPAQLYVLPELGTAAAIDAAISTDGTGLCSTTPIGGGLAAARDALAQVADGQRQQAALLITDGDDNCDGRDGYLTDSLATADQLAADGAFLYVVGFDGSGAGIDEAQLNDLACAGHTAPNFTANCQATQAGFRASLAPSPSRLFLLADDAASLHDVLTQAASDVCCGCVP